MIWHFEVIVSDVRVLVIVSAFRRSPAFSGLPPRPLYKDLRPCAGIVLEVLSSIESVGAPALSRKKNDLKTRVSLQQNLYYPLRKQVPRSKFIFIFFHSSQRRPQN
jgi:hypothetical protein